MKSVCQSLIGLVCIILLTSCFAREQTRPLETLQIMKQDGSTLTYRVEVADTAALRRKGLMHRKYLAADQGMLLAYPVSRKVAIWMKNTPLPLDIIFINSGGRITKIRPDAVPFSLTSMPSDGKVLAVLELYAGQSEKQGIQVGDQVIHPFFEQ